MSQLIRVYLASLLCIICGFSSFALAQSPKKAVLLDVTGAIGPATQEYVQRGLSYARTQKAELVILRLDTPGGLDKSMLEINKSIVGSFVPVVTYISPSGARAARAGTFILYASHLAAMAPGTSMGAASTMGLSGTPDVQRKLEKDAAAYIHSLADLRNRNVVWAEESVTNDSSLSAEEALKLKVINYVSADLPTLLKDLNGRAVKVRDTTDILSTSDLVIKTFKPGWRSDLLSVITDPSIAYILLLMGIFGLFFEFSKPGLLLPGISGGISLLLAFYAFQFLPINYAGLTVLLVGITLMTMEAYVSTYGILAIGGMIAFAAGSHFLLDAHTPGFIVVWPLILTMSVISAAFFILLVKWTLRSEQKARI